MVQTIGLFGSVYITDRFSKKYLISGSMLCVGLVGFYLATFPSFTGFLLAYAVLALLCEVLYWPALLKAVRLTGNDNEQGRIFGMLEAGRGIIDVIVVFGSLAIFRYMNESPAGLSAAIIYFAIINLVVAVVSFFMIPNDVIRTTDKDGKEVGKNKAAFDGMISAMKDPAIWMVAFTAFSVYCIYTGLTYFMPFLKEIYGLPVTLVGLYGTINQYGLKMFGGPVGGFMADKVCKSAAKYLNICFIVAAVAMFAFINLPHESMNVYVGMACALSFGAIIFTMRAVFFAPMSEVKVPRAITGAAMSIGCLLGYLPNAFTYIIFGNILDNNPGMTGYKMVFYVMVGMAVMGFVFSSILCRFVKQRKALPAESEE